MRIESGRGTAKGIDIGNGLTRRAALALGIATALVVPRVVRAEQSDPVTFGLTPVFLDSDIQLLAMLRRYLERRLDHDVSLVKRRTYQEITGLLRSGELDAAWICGFPLIQYPEQLALHALAQNAASLVVAIENKPAPRLFVEPPLPGPLANGVAFIPYRVENLRIIPIGGAAARNVSPRVGHLHITVDDLPWQWADEGLHLPPVPEALNRAREDRHADGGGDRCKPEFLSAPMTRMRLRPPGRRAR